MKEIVEQRLAALRTAAWALAQPLAVYLLARLQEPSTWRGLMLVATACGMGLTPEQAEAIAAGGLFAAGLVGAVFPDGPK